MTEHPYRKTVYDVRQTFARLPSLGWLLVPWALFVGWGLARSAHYGGGGSALGVVYVSILAVIVGGIFYLALLGFRA